MSGCGCGAARAAAKQAIDNGSVEGTVQVLTNVLNPYAVLNPNAPKPAVQTQDTTGYSNGVFVQTGGK